MDEEATKMVRCKVIVRVFVVSAVLVIICALSTQAYSFPITFDLRGTEGAAIEGSPIGSVSKDGLTAKLTANIGILNQTSSGFGINAPGGGDDTDAIDGDLGIESISIIFDQLVTLDQLVLSSFSITENAGLGIAGVDTILPGTQPSKDIYDFSIDNVVPIGESVILTFSTGNGFSFDEFTVTPVETKPVVTPEPATIVLLGIGLAGLGVGHVRRRFRRKAGL
jgi:hypothetical protein